MHTIIPEGDGWEVELLRDERDTNGSPDSTTLEEKLKGCGFLKLKRQFNGYTAEIRYEERLHNEHVTVEGIVFENRAGRGVSESTPGTLYFRQKEFLGNGCKTEASVYANTIKNEINNRYFSTSQQARSRK